jgi:DNA (cytosine-5)-methyltransferase 1
MCRRSRSETTDGPKRGLGVKLLDLFCGAGGGAVGYANAGFEVYGVDIMPQPHYPFKFRQYDALKVPMEVLCRFDAIHASPPCQGYSITRNNGSGADAPKLIEPVRALLQASGVPYVIENVPGAPLDNPVMICGTSLGLGIEWADLHRHRLFECSFPIMSVACSRRSRYTIRVYGGGSQRERAGGRLISQEDKRKSMGIDWMTRAEMNEAIPPAYTEYIGCQLRAVLMIKRQEAVVA